MPINKLIKKGLRILNINNQQLNLQQQKEQQKQYPISFYNEKSYINKSISASNILLHKQQIHKKNLGDIFTINKVIGIVDNNNQQPLILKLPSTINAAEIIKQFNSNNKIDINKIKKEVNKLLQKTYLNQYNHLANLANIDNYPAKSDEFVLQKVGNNLLFKSAHNLYSNNNQETTNNYNFSIKNGQLAKVFLLSANSQDSMK